MKYSSLLKIITISFFFFSCSIKKGKVSYTSKSDEIIATNKISEYLKEHPKTSIVLKAPNSENKSTQADPNAYIYNAIEKELLIAGFNVKDRGLFNEVVKKSSNINYAELKILTKTDLLLELVAVSTEVEYVTNKFTNKKGEEEVVNRNFTKYGAVIEFKLTIIETNEFAGSYSFYYAPCSTNTSKCECEIAYKKYLGIKFYDHLSYCGDQPRNEKGFEYVSEEAMQKFVRDGVKLMINEMRKG